MIVWITYEHFVNNSVQKNGKITFRVREHTKRKRKRYHSLFNVLKKTLRSEFGRVKYEEYARFIKQNIKEAKTDNSKIFNDLYEILQQNE